MSENSNDEKKGNLNENFSELLNTYSKENMENSFENLLDSYTDKMNEELNMGDLIKGEIISVGQDTVFIDTKTKIDGAVEKAELLDENGEFPYKEGDLLELYIVKMSESEIILSKALSGIGGINLLKDALHNHVPVEGKVAATCKGGFHIDITGKRAFCPISQMDVKYIENPDDYVGSDHRFLIKRIEEEGRNIVVSRREVLEKEIEESKEENLKAVEVGAVLKGKVTNLMPYGAFVELFPGIEGMVHISEISWARVDKTSDAVDAEEEITVKVLGIETVENSKTPKISLSIKQATSDPWESILENFQPGGKVTGKVTRLADFGAFVEIAPGLEGLVHVSEMSYLKRIVKPDDVVSNGELVSVMIKGIDTEKKRISLSIKDAEGDPWIDAAKKFTTGHIVDGRLEKKENFGYFITLMPGVTGLLPKSKISRSYDPATIEKLKEGDPIRVKIEEIKQQERKITLDLSDSTDSDDWKKFENDGDNSMGALGEKLMQAMKAKEEK